MGKARLFIRDALVFSGAFFMLLLSVGSFSAIEQQVQAQNALWNAGQLIVSMPGEWPDDFVAPPPELKMSRSVYTNSVIQLNGNWVNVDIQAVDVGYPLQGRLELSDGAEVSSWQDQIYLSQRLPGVEVGDQLQIGELSQKVAGLIDRQDEISGFRYLINPRILMSWAAFQKTGLWIEGSRVRVRYYFTGESAVIKAFAQKMRKENNPHIKITAPNDQQAWRSVGAKRVQQWQQKILGLVSVVVFSALWFLGKRHRLAASGCAQVMSVFGVSRERAVMAMILPVLTRLFFLLLFWTGLALYGVKLLHEHGFLHDLGAMLQVSFVSFFCWMGVMLSLLWQLSERPIAIWGLRLIFAGCLLLFFAVYVDDPLYVASIFSMQMLFLAALLGVLYLIVYYLGSLLRGFSRLFCLVGSFFRANQEFYTTTILLMVLFVGGFLFINLTLSDLVGRWEKQVPKDSPNVFLINIDGGDLERLRANVLPEDAVLYPVIRARITKVNQQDVFAYRPELALDPSFNRELNMTYMAQLPAHNEIVAGAWQSGAKKVASLEKEFANRAGIRVGDTITVSVFGESVDITVSAIRQVQWQSLRPNFFVITTQDILGEYPAAWMTSFYWPQGDFDTLYYRMQAFPNISVINIQQVMAGVQVWLDRLQAYANVYTMVILGLLGFVVLSILYQHIQALNLQRQLLFSALVPVRLIYQAELTSSFIVLAVGYLLLILMSWALYLAVARFLPGLFMEVAGYSFMFFIAFGLGIWRYIFIHTQKLYGHLPN